MYQNIPTELRSLPQWVVSGPDKIPIHPRTGQKASVTDPTSWATFEEAVKTGYKHIGFVLTPNDPYTIIDLDNKPQRPLTQEQKDLHNKILSLFTSYTERSTSGLGYHIIVKGSLPAGVHSRDGVEVYSSGRYMICTGNVVRQAPIENFQEYLDRLYGEIKTAPIQELTEKEGPLNDRDLVDMARYAENGEKFDALCNGKWQELGYPSQSEADYALLSMFTFYTQDNEQVRRLFRYSKLGKRDKALKNNTYLNRCLEKIRAVQSPGANIDFTALREQMEQLVYDATHPEVTTEKENLNGETPVTLSLGDSLPPPPGLVGELANYIYSSSVRPVPEVSLAAALGLMAGVAGRAYNTNTNTGLNLYIILLAQTGRGKEGAASGIDRIISATRPTVPMVDEFIGPAHFASGQALVKAIDEKTCFLSILAEFGYTLQNICDARANAADVMLKKVLLDLYMKSGSSATLRSSVYSDKEKNTKLVHSPALTILGESTPERFFDGLDLSHVTEGLIPRLCCIEYTGLRTKENKSAGAPPPPDLIARFSEVVVKSLACQQNNSVMPVAVNDHAQFILDGFNGECDEKINKGTQLENEMWTRAHLKALRLSALLAVGVNPHQPVVTPELAEWAIKFTRKDVNIIISRFVVGDVGSGDGKMMAELKKIILQYVAGKPKEIAQTYWVEEKMIEDGVIPYVYMQRRTAGLSSFKKDKRGASAALRATIDDMVRCGHLQEVPKLTMQDRYRTSAVGYVIRKAWFSKT